MGTTLTYGGMVIVNCLTKQFDQDPVYDESGTDILYHKITITVIGYVHRVTTDQESNTTTFIKPASASNNATDVFADITKEALTARQALKYSLGDDVLVSSNVQDPGGGVLGKQIDKDVFNGPKPRSFNILQVVNSNIYKVEFQVETALVLCVKGSNSSGVLNNRWSMIDDINQNFYTTRTMRGRLVLTSSNLNPHDFRDVVVPKLQAGFRRKSIHVVGSADGLALDYDVVDEEVYAAIPPPATSWSAQHTVVQTLGAVAKSQLRLTLDGAANTSKKKLFALAAAIIDVRLGILQGKQQFGKFTVLNTSLTDHLDANRVSVQILIQHAAATGTQLISIGDKLGSGLEGLNFDGTYSINTSTRSPDPTGTATTAGLFACYLQDACNPTHGVPDPSRINTEGVLKAGTGDVGQLPSAGGSAKLKGTVDGTKGTKVTVQRTVDKLPTTEPKLPYASDHKTDIYEMYEISNTYFTAQQRVAVPIMSIVSAIDSDTLKSSDSVFFATLGRPTTTRTIQIRAVRNGEWPAVPTPLDELTDTNGVMAKLLSNTLTPAAPEVLVGLAGKQHIISGTLVYAYARALTSSDKRDAGSLPWDTQTMITNVMPTSVFETGITT